MEVTGQFHDQAALPGSRFPLNGRLGGSQTRPGRFAQKLPPLTPVNLVAHRLGSLSEYAPPFSFYKGIRINSRNL